MPNLSPNMKLNQILALILLSVILPSLRASNPICDKMDKEKCFCSTGEQMNYEVHCPGKTIYQINPHFIQMECLKLKFTDYNSNNMPNLELGNVPSIKIKNCPMQSDTSISVFLKKIGINKTNVLTLEFGDLDIDLSRPNFRELGNITSLKVGASAIKSIPVDIFYDLKNLVWITFRANIHELPRDILSHCSKLEHFELTHSKLKTLEPGVFDNLKNLKSLSLWSNRLQNLTKESFRGTSSVESLDIGANGIEYLNSDIFHHLTNMMDINLNANSFKYLPKGLFEHNKRLTKIRLMNSKLPLPTLPAGMLSNLPELNETHLTDLIQVPGDLFANSDGLTYIKMQMNAFQELPETLFGSQVNLKTLYLNNNKLISLPDNIFQNTTSLFELHLENNQLTNITRSLFANLASLQYLYLQNNKIISIDQEAFISTSGSYLQIKYIDLSNNKLYEGNAVQFQSEFAPLRDTLETLNLSNNSVRHIFDDWKFMLTKLVSLDLRHNQITKLTDNDIKFVPDTRPLLTIDLSHNKIDQINFDGARAYNLSRLNAHIDLTNNPIDCNCNILSFVQYLRDVSTNDKLRLQVDKLACEKPENLQKKPVQFVNPLDLLCILARNESKSQCPVVCACNLRKSDRHVIVNCSQADLTTIPTLPLVDGYEKVILHIENNAIDSLPKINLTTGGYSNVVRLYASNNNIITIDKENIPHHLEYIDLSDNKLQNLDPSVFDLQNESRPIQMKLSKNDWVCDCDSIDFLSYVQGNTRNIEDYQDLKCSSGSKISMITNNDVCPTDQTFFIVGGCLLALSGLLMGLIVALFYKYQQLVKAWLYHQGWFRWLVTEEELDKDKKYDAFISFSHVDEEFVIMLIKKLESGLDPYKVCVHFRDWTLGEFIGNQITKSVEESRRTVVVLSANFLKSEWGKLEFRTAHIAALTERRARVIVIILGDIGDIETIDPELKAYLKTTTYVTWGHAYFWEQLIYALPHKPTARNQNNSHINGITVDDKLELIKQNSIMSIPPLTTPPIEKHINHNMIVNQQPNGHVGHNNHINQTFHSYNGHENRAFIINPNAKQSDV